jgi:hypothetical protein
MFGQLVRARTGTDSVQEDPTALITLMLDREAVLRKEHGSEVVMFSGKGKKSKKGTSVAEKDIECYGCHKKGHKRSECPDKEKRSKSNSDIECYECHEKGHKRPECPERERSTTAASVARTRDSGDLLLMVSTSASERTLEDWYIDSACTQHVTGTKAYFVDYKDGRTVLTAFNGSEVISSGFGDVRLKMRLPDGQERRVQVRGVFYVPGAFNLLSQGTLFENGEDMRLTKGFGYKIYDRDRLSAVAPCVGKLFPLDSMVHKSTSPVGKEIRKGRGHGHRHPNCCDVTRKSKTRKDRAIDRDKHVECFQCHEKGHRKALCPESPDRPRAGGNDFATPVGSVKAGKEPRCPSKISGGWSNSNGLGSTGDGGRTSKS